jgi:hypothetical protein
MHPLVPYIINKECKFRLCPATALVTAMGLRINLSCIIMRPHMPGPIAISFSCGHIMIPFEIMPRILAMLQDTAPEELRIETIQNSKMLDIRNINMSWDTVFEGESHHLLPWDDSAKRFIGDGHKTYDDDLLHATDIIPGTPLRNKKIRPPLPHDQLDIAVRTLLPASQRLSLVPRDGHCLFRALALCFGLGQSHVQLRGELVEFVAKNWHGEELEFAEWTSIANPGDTTADFYKVRMLPPSRQWGDYSEIEAAAAIYQHHIVILEYIADENRLHPILVEVPGKEDEEAPTIHLARVGQNHFHAGIPIAVHWPNAHPFTCPAYHSHALPISNYSSRRA